MRYGREVTGPTPPPSTASAGACSNGWHFSEYVERAITTTVWVLQRLADSALACFRMGMS